MCIIMVKEAGAAMPPKERFEGMFDRNSDGAGFMYPDGGWVKYQKGLMTFDDFWGAFQAALTPEMQKALPVVCHFRIGTHGDKKAPTHTHPFPLTDNVIDMTATSGRAQHAVMHNGIFSLPGIGKWKFATGEKDEKGGDIYVVPSDTMDYVRDILFPISLKKNWFDLKPMHRIIDMTIGYSKLVIMRGDGKILRFGEFVKHPDDAGVEYSNSNYVKYTYVAPAKKSYSGRYDDEDSYDEYGWYVGSRRSKNKNEKRSKSSYVGGLKPPSARKNGYVFSKFKAASYATQIASTFVDEAVFVKPGDKFADVLGGSWFWYIPTRDGILKMYRALSKPNKVWLYEYDADANVAWYVGGFYYEQSKLISDTTTVKDPIKEIEYETTTPLLPAPEATEPVA